MYYGIQGLKKYMFWVSEWLSYPKAKSSYLQLNKVEKIYGRESKEGKEKVREEREGECPLRHNVYLIEFWYNDNSKSGLTIIYIMCLVEMNII